MKKSVATSFMWQYETRARNKGYTFVIGLDEAGRGPLAGPVVAAAVFLRKPRFTCRIDDSKKLTPRQRERAMDEITRQATWGVGVMSSQVIDQCNIVQATSYAMSNAVWHLIARLPDKARNRLGFREKVCLLVDGKYFKSDLPFAYQTIVRGDGQSLSIACASIIAKVVRDRFLGIYQDVFPGYDFSFHKGYPTARHCRSLQALGPSPIHRRTFRYKIHDTASKNISG